MFDIMAIIVVLMALLVALGPAVVTIGVIVGIAALLKYLIKK